MTTRAERKRQRYAEDPDYRSRVLATNHRYSTAHKEEIAAKARHKWATDADFRERGLAASRARDSHADKLKQVYGLSTADYNAMLRQQNGACAICRRTSAERLCVDHCHKTNRVRGLLCRKCNTGLGCYGDDPERIAAAIAYLQAKAGKVGSPRGRTAPAKTSAIPRCSAVPASPAPGARDAGQRLPLPALTSPRPAAAIALYCDPPPSEAFFEPPQRAPVPAAAAAGQGTTGFEMAEA
jgi:hypothetical protein